MWFVQLATPSAPPKPASLAGRPVRLVTETIQAYAQAVLLVNGLTVPLAVLALPIVHHVSTLTPATIATLAFS